MIPLKHRMLIWYYRTSMRWLQWIAKASNLRMLRARNWLMLRYEYRPRIDDIFISTYPKSGTTWLQNILYQLTTDGDMDFKHIYEHSPFFEYVNSKDFADLPSPRLFKTHLPYSYFKKFDRRVKFIYVVRDGKDVAVSFYHHFKGVEGFKGTFDQFFNDYISGRLDIGTWFDHVSGWYKNSSNLNILFIKYSELISDFPGTLNRIIDFCGIENADLERVYERCTFAFMKEHEVKFDHKTYLEMKRPEAVPFIRKGKTNQWSDELTEAQINRFNHLHANYFGNRSFS